MQQGTCIASASKVYRGKPAKQTVQPNSDLPMVVAVQTDIAGGMIDDLPDEPLQLTPDSSGKLHHSIAARHTACIISSMYRLPKLNSMHMVMQWELQPSCIQTSHQQRHPCCKDRQQA